MNSFVHHFHFHHILREELCWSVLLREGLFPRGHLHQNRVF